MLLPVDSQESFEPMGTHGYRIAIGGGTSPHNLRGYAVLKDDVQRYRKAWQEAGHPGDPPRWSACRPWWPRRRRRPSA